MSSPGMEIALSLSEAMRKTNPYNEKPESPFFELLADAEEIKIRELCPENKQKLASAVEKSLENWENGDDGTHRTFFVHIKAKPPKAAVSPTPEEAPANRVYLLRSADLLLADSDYVLARNIYSYLLKSNIRDVDALKGLGICFARLGEVTSARKCFKALLEISNREECWIWLGQCHVAEGDDAQAVDCFRKITNPSALSPSEQFDLCREMGNCLTRCGKLDEAWSAYHSALELQPASDIIYVNLGTLELQRNHPAVALSCFNKAVELNPQNSRAYCGLGLVAVGKDDAAGAEKAFCMALNIDSQNQVALFQLVNLAQKSATYSGAEERLQTFLSKDPKHAEARYALASLLFRQGEWTRCERELDTLLSTSPDHAKARALREELSSNRHAPT